MKRVKDLFKWLWKWAVPIGLCIATINLIITVYFLAHATDELADWIKRNTGPAAL